MEPGVRAARAPGAGRARVPQLGALSAARPRCHRPPQLPQRSHGLVVSPDGLFIKLYRAPGDVCVCVSDGQLWQKV